ncbi:ArsR family transcriptional regulator [Methanofollis fontis]|uniref:ArsR family transcriptional regulator n=2 Tax=Methanofollis fontis TaxID=2052832 RepID=A0A483CV17_9EURY|nr:ArsR family transcriptional regulator [Methanofollis fontis]
MWGRVAFLVLALALVQAVSAAYVVSPGGAHPPSGPPAALHEVAVWELPLWVVLLEVCVLPLELLGAAKTCLALGWRRVAPRNVLDHPLRSEIYDAIRASPGIHLRGLSDVAAMPLSTLRYHLAVLEEHHKITTLDEDGYRRFYENSGTYTQVQQRVFKHLRNATTRQILVGILEHPGATRQEIADILGISGPAVTWHVNRLAEDRIISRERDGRAVRYRIREDAAIELVAGIGNDGAVVSFRA